MSGDEESMKVLYICLGVWTAGGNRAEERSAIDLNRSSRSLHYLPFHSTVTYYRIG